MRLTKTKIKQTLKQFQFDPKEPGPLKPILEVGNSDYYLQRAIEFLASDAEDKSTNVSNAVMLLIIWLALQ